MLLSCPSRAETYDVLGYLDRPPGQTTRLYQSVTFLSAGIGQREVAQSVEQGSPLVETA